MGLHPEWVVASECPAWVEAVCLCPEWAVWVVEVCPEWVEQDAPLATTINTVAEAVVTTQDLEIVNQERLLAVVIQMMIEFMAAWAVEWDRVKAAFPAWVEAVCPEVLVEQDVPLAMTIDTAVAMVAGIQDPEIVNREPPLVAVIQMMIEFIAVRVDQVRVLVASVVVKLLWHQTAVVLWI